MTAEDYIESVYKSKIHRFKLLGKVEIKQSGVEMTPGVLLDLYQQGFYGEQFETVRNNIETFLAKVDKRDNFQYSLALMYTNN